MKYAFFGMQYKTVCTMGEYSIYLMVKVISLNKSSEGWALYM